MTCGPAGFEAVDDAIRAGAVLTRGSSEFGA
jgi:hypothetical protein